MRNLKSLRSEIAAMADGIVARLKASSPLDELERQVAAAYIFGMVFAIGQIEKLTPPEVHALVLAVLQDAFQYDPVGATKFAEELIRASQSVEHHRTMNLIIHRGISGHRLWTESAEQDVDHDIRDIVEKLRIRQ